MRHVVITVLVLIVAYGSTLGIAYFGQRKLMYLPDPTRISPQSVGLDGVVELRLAASENVSNVAWYQPAAPGKPTIVYFHGNAGSLASRAARFARFTSLGWGVMALAYRGYAGSTGSPSETNNVEDARRALQYVRDRGVALSQVVLYGESLGTGVATRIAAENAVAGLLLDAPFTSTVDVARSMYWFLPVRLLLADRYENIAHIRHVTAPILIIHGVRDRTIPIAMGRRLAEAAGNRARLVEFPLGGHVDLFEPHNDAMRHVRPWVEAVTRSVN